MTNRNFHCIVGLFQFRNLPAHPPSLKLRRAREGGEIYFMTKKDLIDLVGKKASLTNKAAREAAQAVLDGIRDALKRGEKVVLTGFGTFSVRSRAARKGRNPRTGDVINIAARKTPGFTAGKALKRAVR